MTPGRKKVKVSRFDGVCYKRIRQNVSRFLCSQARAKDRHGALILDIAPQEHEGAAYYFKKAVVETFDIDPASGADHIGDITKRNRCLPGGKYDVVVCTEVFEHTLDPFAAVKEIKRILKPSGVLLATVPFNFRIHGPLPDCWRFTEHGLRALLKDLSDVVITPLETPGRGLMPMHYTIVAKKER